MQLSAQEWLSIAGTFQAEYILGIEPVVSLEKFYNVFSFLHVFTRQYKDRSFTGRKKTTMGDAFPSSKLSILTIEILILNEKYIQSLWINMWHECQHYDNLFIKSNFGNRCYFL